MYSRIFAVSLGLFAAGGHGPAAAESAGLALARASQCLSCHQVDAKRVGPPFSAVAERFAGAAGAQDYLADTIRSGGKDRWGPIPMPAQPQVSPGQAQAIAAWILSLTKEGARQP